MHSVGDRTFRLLVTESRAGCPHNAVLSKEPCGTTLQLELRQLELTARLEMKTLPIMLFRLRRLFLCTHTLTPERP